jgi:hypothetical protein
MCDHSRRPLDDIGIEAPDVYGALAAANRMLFDHVSYELIGPNGCIDVAEAGGSTVARVLCAEGGYRQI